MPRLTKEDKARKALQLHLDSKYSEEQQEDIAFYTDVEDSDSYTWRMEVEGNKLALKYVYSSSKVVETSF